ncbi:hypothetical protein BGLA2_240013 [Burkholderia gladioli]|nr:hypothetical protein BGLA2_240013 [Burkholderia gladioli]
MDSDYFLIRINKGMLHEGRLESNSFWQVKKGG